jgi:hypothetical protein
MLSAAPAEEPTRTIVFPHSAGNTLVWSADRDCFIVGIYANTTSFCVSRTGIAYSAVNNSGVVRDDLIAMLVFSSSASFRCRIPLKQNDKVYSNSIAGGHLNLVVTG